MFGAANRGNFLIEWGWLHIYATNAAGWWWCSCCSMSEWPLLFACCYFYPLLFLVLVSVILCGCCDFCWPCTWNCLKLTKLVVVGFTCMLERSKLYLICSGWVVASLQRERGSKWWSLLRALLLQVVNERISFFHPCLLVWGRKLKA